MFVCLTISALKNNKPACLQRIVDVEVALEEGAKTVQSPGTVHIAIEISCAD